MSEAKTHRLMPDTIFAGRYRIASSIGEGAMGTVYLAKVIAAAGDEQRCAVKILKPKIASEHTKGRERFARDLACPNDSWQSIHTPGKASTHLVKHPHTW